MKFVTIKSLSINQEKQPAIDEKALEFIKELPIALYICDTEGRITYYNKAAAEIWGREPVLEKERWCGSWKIFYSDGTPVSLDDCPMAISIKEGKDAKPVELIIEKPDGTRSYIIPYPKNIYDEDGNLTGALNLIIDLTEKKLKDQVIIESEKKYRELSESLERIVESRTLNLKKSEERYHKMVDEVQDYAILLLDTEGNIINWNKGAEKIKGYTEKEIIGKNFRNFYLPEDRERKLPDQLLARAVTTGRAMHEGWRMRKDGTKFWGSIVLTALHDDQNNVIGFSKVTRDLTERKLAEMQLKQYASDIENQNKKLEEFVYVASHDLQEPLRKILTFADLLEKKIDDKEAVRKNLSKITQSAQRMSNLIKDILKYSRLSKTDELMVQTDLNAIFEEVMESFSLLIQQHKAVVKKTNLPIINCIPIHLYQLFSNLLSNSLKFSDTTPVINISSQKISENEIYRLNLDHGKVYYKIKFEDNGMGFNQEYADQVFKLFKRFSENKEGTGIGLALCKQIVEAHKGRINVKSDPGKGTSFEIILPEV